jgi:transposase-like protein
MKCIYCQGDCIKTGKMKNVQGYQCKACNKTQQKRYNKTRISQEKYQEVHRLNNECCGISHIARLLYISKSSAQRVIIRMASKIQKLDFFSFS